MTDARDAVAEALARTRRVAAGRLVRKDELEAELAKRKEQRAGLEGIEGPEAEALARDLDARIAAVAGELATVTAELRDAQAEIANLTKLGRDAPAAAARATVAAATERDPILRSPEEIALDNARAHISELESQVKANEELAKEEPPPPGNEEEPPPPPPGRPKKTL